VDDGPLGERRIEIADRGAGVVDPAVDPGVKDGFADVEVVGVALEVVDHLVGLRREAPDVTLPEGGRLGFIDFVDSPVVSASKLGRVRHVEIAGDGGSGFGAGGYRIGIGAEVDLVRGRRPARAPAQGRRHIHLDFAVSRQGSGRISGDGQESDFAQAVLAQRAPAAVDGQPDVFGRHAAEIDGRIVDVPRPGGCPGELHVSQHGPFGAVRGVLDRDALEPEAENQLKIHVVVPDQHLVQLVDAVELVLNPDRIGAVRRAQPHGGGVRRMLVVGIEARAIDSVLGSLACLRHRVAGRDDILDGVRQRFGRESPDRPFDDRAVGRRVHLVDPPVVGLAEFETAGIARRVALTLADQHTHGIGPAGGVDVVENRSEVYVMRLGERPWRPGEVRVPPDVRIAVGRIGVGRQVTTRQRGLCPKVHPVDPHLCVQVAADHRPVGSLQHQVERNGFACLVAQGVSAVRVFDEIGLGGGSQIHFLLHLRGPTGTVEVRLDENDHLPALLGFGGEAEGIGLPRLQQQPALGNPDAGGCRGVGHVQQDGIRAREPRTANGRDVEAGRSIAAPSGQTVVKFAVDDLIVLADSETAGPSKNKRQCHHTDQLARHVRPPSRKLSDRPQANVRAFHFCRALGRTHCIAASETTFDASRPGGVSGS